MQLLRAVGADGKVVLTGGLSKDPGMVRALEDVVGEEKAKKRPKPLPELAFVTHPDGILAGAIGAALLGAFRKEQLERRQSAQTEMPTRASQ